MKFLVLLCLLPCLSWAKPQYNGDPSLAKILQEQRFNLANDKFGHAAQQEDGVIIREESNGKNHRIGQYQYIGDDGKTYTVKYEAGVNGFRILDGSHIPSGGQTAATATQLNEDEDDYVYDYQYYDDTPVESVFVNPYDKSHQQPQLLAGNLAGHLAGLYREPEPKPKNSNTVPRPLQPEAAKRFFPPGELKFDRFANGFNFNFRSNKK